MAITDLRTSAGKPLVVQQGESCDVVATFADMTGAAIAKANLATLTATLYDEATGTTINGRDAGNVKDANGGTVASDGTLTLRLDADDTPIVGDVDAGDTERHVLRLEWTWSDGVRTRQGKAEYGISVEALG